jgi:NAD(P)-dependent dehydrogenase (short-subunit alcohol dehydrogenase family)
MTTFRDRVVLITGAASGIGRQLARLFAKEGARLAALDYQAEALRALTAELPGTTVATADVTDLPATRAAVAQLETQVGPTDILIACAGIGRKTSALDFRAEDFAAQIQVNLTGVANSIDAVLPGMRQRRAGHLVVLSSLASYRGLPMMAGYCASKAGVNALIDAIRIELRPLGIVTTTVCPGWIRTPLLEGIDVPKADIMEVEEAARRILGAVRARRRFIAFPPSSVWRVRLLRYLPGGVSDWITERMLRSLTK